MSNASPRWVATTKNDTDGHWSGINGLLGFPGLPLPVAAVPTPPRRHEKTWGNAQPGGLESKTIRLCVEHSPFWCSFFRVPIRYSSNRNDSISCLEAVHVLALYSLFIFGIPASFFCMFRTGPVSCAACCFGGSVVIGGWLWMVDEVPQVVGFDGADRHSSVVLHSGFCLGMEE